MFEWARLKTVFRRWVFPSPYFPQIIIPLDFLCSHTISSLPEISFMILGRASEKYCPTAREGMPERSASIICLASISYIVFYLLHCNLDKLGDSDSACACLGCNFQCAFLCQRGKGKVILEAGKAFRDRNDHIRRIFL